MMHTGKLSFADGLTVSMGDRSFKISGIAWILHRQISGECSRYYCVGVKKDKKLVVVEQGERGDALLFSIYEHRRFENMMDHTVRHYPSELLRDVAYKLGVKEVRCIDGKMHPVDKFLPNSPFG
jgi:hypothetical protein